MGEHSMGYMSTHPYEYSYSCFKSRFTTWIEGCPSGKNFENMAEREKKKKRGFWTKHRGHFIQFQQGSIIHEVKDLGHLPLLLGFLCLQKTFWNSRPEEATDHKVYNAPWPCRTTFIIFLLDLSMHLIISQVSPFHRFTPGKKGGRQILAHVANSTWLLLITTKFMLDQTFPGKKLWIHVNGVHDLDPTPRKCPVFPISLMLQCFEMRGPAQVEQQTWYFKNHRIKHDIYINPWRFCWWIPLFQKADFFGKRHHKMESRHQHSH